MDRRPIDRLIHPFQVFASHKLAGALLLMGAAVLAIIWANSPLAHLYTGWLSAHATAGIAGIVIDKPLLLWINDGLMGVFFFLVGLEIKREVSQGELSTVRKASLPAVAAIGGMVVPAALYAAFNLGGPGSAGWGIPMATDIAFALGVLALLGDRVPVGLKVFLTALAIVDDIGAVLVIAIFYTEDLSVWSLAIGAVLYAVALGLNRLQARSDILYLLIGVAVWVAFLKSGVHATVAALLMAFAIPSRTRIDGQSLIDQLTHSIRRLREVGVPVDRRMNSVNQQHVIDHMATEVEQASSPLLRLEHALVPIVTFFVLPVFALANAGVAPEAGILEALQDPIAVGTIAGLFLGKQIGVTLFAWIAVKLRVADLPTGVTWRQVHGAGLLAGIGFTMSLFISGLAFPDPALNDVAKVGILAASILSGVAGWLVLRSALPPPRPADAGGVGSTSDGGSKAHSPER